MIDILKVLVRAQDHKLVIVSREPLKWETRWIC